MIGAARRKRAPSTIPHAPYGTAARSWGPGRGSGAPRRGADCSFTSEDRHAHQFRRHPPPFVIARGRFARVTAAAATAAAVEPRPGRRAWDTDSTRRVLSSRHHGNPSAELPGTRGTGAEHSRLPPEVDARGARAHGEDREVSRDRLSRASTGAPHVRGRDREPRRLYGQPERSHDGGG